MALRCIYGAIVSRLAIIACWLSRLIWLTVVWFITIVTLRQIWGGFPLVTLLR